MPKVSVIIPTYNVEPYLVECMESITRQTLKDIEIICINDGSTDGSLKILKEYAAKDDRIKIVDKENGGYGIGMNIGLDMATGEYIEIFVNPKNPTELYEPADNFSSEDYINSEWVTIKNLTIGGTLLMLTGWTLICFIL